MIYSDLVDEFPREMREPMFRLIDRLVEDLSDSPTRADFHRLESLVEMQGENILALAQAQARTEQKLGSLAQRVEELAQAQARTEQRLGSLAQRVEELAQAQVRTEQRLGSLAQQVGELAQAQARTELRVQDVQKRMGSMSHNMGYRLENEAIWLLPLLLGKDHSIKVLGDLRRDFVPLSDGKFVEANIIGEGIKEGNHVTILGEAKTQLKKRDVDKFVSLVSAIQSEVPYPVVSLLITHQTSPQVRQYALEKGIIVYFSYQLRPVATL